MLGPNEHDWGYQEIANVCPAREAKLASAGPPDALIDALDDALKEALAADTRIGFDGISNDLSAPRVWVQFPVRTELYDWFFSGRTGYRAQYWISPDVGQTLNMRLVQRLQATIGKWAPCSGVVGREIWVNTDNGYREDIDRGPRTESRNTVLTSLDPGLSKIWICERLIQRKLGTLVPVLGGRKNAKLRIPKWAPSGLWTPLPEKGDAWLDIKGGYVQPDGTVAQPYKSPEQRASQLHRTGGT